LTAQEDFTEHLNKQGQRVAVGPGNVHFIVYVLGVIAAWHVLAAATAPAAIALLLFQLMVLL